jgi:hypothetical protein
MWAEKVVKSLKPFVSCCRSGIQSSRYESHNSVSKGAWNIIIEAVNEVPAKDSDNAFDVSRGYGHISDGLKRATSGKRETSGCRFSLVDAYYLANSS